jgi:peptidoglycan/xylan/chitin deacetylase (PgdA/CDA1 family)
MTNQFDDFSTGSGDSRCLAVMYHYVRDRSAAPDEAIAGLNVADFERQIDELTGFGTPVNWRTFNNWLTGKGEIPDPCVLLTFDDGLADHAEVVAPILKKRGISGLFFVPGRIWREKKLLTAHAGHILLARLGADHYARAVRNWLGERGIAPELTPEQLAEARRLYHYESAELGDLKYLLSFAVTRDSRENMLDELFRQHIGDPVDHHKQWYLSAEQAKTLEADGHTIGGHGYLHAPLGKMDPADAQKDLEQSAETLNEVLGEADRPMTWPFGSYNRTAQSAAVDAGFACAFSTNEVWIEPGSDAQALGRVDTIHVEKFLQKECGVA